MRYRNVHTKMWRDPTFLKLPPSSRFVFVNLMTNEAYPISGIYPVALSTIVYETGHDVRTVRKAMKGLEEHGMIRYFAEEEIVWVVNGLRYTLEERKPDAKMRNDIKKALIPIARTPEILEAFLSHYCSIFAEYGLDVITAELQGLCTPLAHPLHTPCMGQTFLPQKCDKNVMSESTKSILYPPAIPISHFDFNDPKYKYKYRSSSSNEEEGDPMDRDDSFSEFCSNGDGTFVKRYPDVAQGCNRYELGVIEQYEILVGNCFGPDELVMLRELMEKYPPGVIKSGIRHLATKYGEAFAEQGFAYCYEPIMKGAFGSERKKRRTDRKKTQAHDPRNSGGQGTGLEDYGDMKRKVATRIAKDG